MNMVISQTQASGGVVDPTSKKERHTLLKNDQYIWKNNKKDWTDVHM